MKTRYYVCLMLAVILLLFGGFTAIYVHTGENSKNQSDFHIVTSFYPLYVATLYITDGIDGVSVTNMSEPQTGCLHDFQMTPADMQLLSKADVFVVNGGGIESFLDDVVAQYKELTLITATENITLLVEEEHEEDEQEHEADEEHAHEHGSENAHVWMSISGYREMVSNIAKTLAETDSAHAKAYLSNAKKYDEQLAELASYENEIRGQLQNQSVVLLHPAYEYLAGELGLNVVATIDLDEERQISAGEIADTLSSMKECGSVLVLAEETYGKEMSEILRKEGGAYPLYLNPLTRKSEISDFDYYLVEMRKNLDLLKGYYEKNN